MSDIKIPADLEESEFLERTKGLSDECFLRALQEWRYGLWRPLKAQGDFFETLSGMYSDKAHFVYELLQNAEDAEASEVAFSLSDDALTVTHNGKRLFTRADIISITTAGRSAKTELNAIGKFGVGFKSVFAVTDAPEIHSGNFHFRIENYIVPRPISSPAVYGAASQTTIRLPLKNGGDGVREQIRKAISSFSATVTIFLKNIRMLKWECKQSGESDFCEKSEGLEQCGNNISAGITKFRNKNADNCGEYFFLRRHEELGGKLLYLAAACRMQNGGIVKMHPSPQLSVYFPMAKENPELSFMLHVPYRTTPTRETCEFGDADNKVLTERAAVFVADTLPVLRDSGQLSPNVINDVLPWGSGGELYSAVVAKVKGKFASEKLLPTTAGNEYATAQEVVAGDKYLPVIMNAGLAMKAMPAQKRHDGRSLWLSNGIHGKVRDALGIPDYSLSRFGYDAGDEFLRLLSCEQMTKFYRMLLKQHKEEFCPPRGREWRSKRDERIEHHCSSMQLLPIVRLVKPHNDGKLHVSAYARDGRLLTRREPFAYLPKEGGAHRFPTVNPIFLKDREAAEFLREILQMREPGDIDEIRAIVRHYAHNKIEAHDHAADMRAILKIAAAQTNAVKNVVYGKPVVKTINGSGECGFASFSRSFFGTDDLRRVFAGDKNAHFVDESFYDANVAESGDWRRLFCALGVEPFHISEFGEIEHAINCIDKSEGGEEFGRSVALWRLLSASVRAQNENVRDRLREQLGKVSWLYDQSQNRISPPSKTLEDIHPQYRAGLPDNNIPALTAKAAGLRVDDIKELKRQLKESDSENERLRKKVKELEGKLKPRTPTPAPVEPRAVEPRTIEVVLGYSWPPEKEKSNNDGGGIAVSCGENAGGDSANNKAKGKIGEASLYKWLEEQYPGKVTNANASSGEQKGYDISVDKPEGVTAYYECKSFDSATPPRRVQMTRAQMEKAEAAEEAGDQYFLCVIFDIDGDPVSMLNPIRDPAKLAKTETRWSVDISSSGRIINLSPQRGDAT